MTPTASRPASKYPAIQGAWRRIMDELGLPALVVSQAERQQHHSQASPMTHSTGPAAMKTDRAEIQPEATGPRQSDEAWDHSHQHHPNDQRKR